MKKGVLAFAVAIFTTALIGCGTAGKDFNMSMANKIQVQQTTQGEIESMLGQPFKKGIQNGRPIWVYEFNYYHTLGDDTSKDLVVIFNDDGKVRSYQAMSNRSISE